MININLYQSGKLDVTLDLPASWNELLPDEVVFIAKTILHQNESTQGITRPQILKYVVERRAAIENKKLPRNWMVIVDKEQMVMEGYPLLDFIFNQNQLTNTPDAITFSIWKKRYHPLSFSDITCGEFEDCEMLATNFTNDPSGKSLAAMAAILFRPVKNKSLVPYMVFNFKTNQYRTYDHASMEKYFEKLAPELLYSIFIWYTGCRAQLPGMFPNVYENNGDGQGDPLAFTNCIHSGAGPKNGTRNQIRVMKMFEFMYDMEEEAKKAKQLQEEYERIKHAR